jgi:hypothetical protein
MSDKKYTAQIMATLCKLISALCIFMLIACNKSINQQNESSDYTSNIVWINGRYGIDTNAILNNNNLQYFITELANADLSDKKTVAEIPSFIQSFLENLTGDFSIANPGEEWKVGCTGPMETDSSFEQKQVDSKTGDTLVTVMWKPKDVPSRQLIYLGIGNNIALMTYYTGGIGKSEHILIIKFDHENITDFWCGNILTDVTTKTDIIKFLKENKDQKWELNTNMIYL